MVAAGLFDGEQVELLGGVVVEMSPSGPVHAHVITVLAELLRAATAGRAVVREEKPFAAGEHDEPEPDVAVVPRGDYWEAHPDRAFLVVEVADTSLRTDRRVKPSIYAAAGVPEYWVVNLRDALIEVHTDIVSGEYTKIVPGREGESITLAALDGATIEISRVFRHDV